MTPDLKIPAPLSSLPLARHARDLQEWIAEERHLLLIAPTGTGKSSFLPWFLAHAEGQRRIAVLQPRRIAALGLARHLARCLSEEVGQTVGYRFRFDARQGPNTRILFETYGSFLQQVLHSDQPDPWDWIVFDEFHERRADMDLLFNTLFALHLSAPKSVFRLAILSADLNQESLERFMGIPCRHIASPAHPVQILHQEPKLNEPLPAQVLRAVRSLELNGVRETTLVFLPGKSEIEACRESLEQHYRLAANKPEILSLHGSQEMTEQQRVFEPSDPWRVILSTNIAETSLTIPGVTAVIDSGLERLAEYDPKRRISQLRLSRISLQNALQRKGRAGRLRPGLCIRLWNQRDESLMSPEIVPEILRLALPSILLHQLALAEKLGLEPRLIRWLTPPPADRLAEAYKFLADKGLLRDGALSAQGRAVLDIPVADLDLALFLHHQSAVSEQLLAAIALADTGQYYGSLPDLAQEFLSRPQKFPREARQLWDRLRNWYRGAHAKQTPEIIQQAFLDGFPDRLAILAENRKAYRLGEDTILIDPAHAGNAPAIIAVSFMQTIGKTQQINQCLYVPISQTVLDASPSSLSRWEVVWKPAQERFTGLEIRTRNHRELSRREVAFQDAPTEVRPLLADLVQAAWMEKIARENLDYLWMDPVNQTLTAKMLWAARLFPEYGFPQWNSIDHQLILGELTHGVFLQKDLNPERYRHIVEEYFGKDMIPWLKRTFPDTVQLANGKIGKYHYPHPDQGPVELRARIGDFLGMRGEQAIAEGRLKVRYDILAPNFRTVQKTWDLSGFWKNAYPQIRKELRGRYPRHPWPENPEAYNDR